MATNLTEYKFHYDGLQNDSKRRMQAFIINEQMLNHYSSIVNAKPTMNTFQKPPLHITTKSKQSRRTLLKQFIQPLIPKVKPIDENLDPSLKPERPRSAMVIKYAKYTYKEKPKVKGLFEDKLLHD